MATHALHPSVLCAKYMDVSPTSWLALGCSFVFCTSKLSKFYSAHFDIHDDYIELNLTHAADVWQGTIVKRLI